MSEVSHLPWMVAIPRTPLEPQEEVTFVLESPRATRSLRRIVLSSSYAYGLTVVSLKLGSVETGREILETGPIPGAVLTEESSVQTFDVPVEKGQAIALVVRNHNTQAGMIVEGVLLGLGP